MWVSFGWGTLAASSLVIGAVIALVVQIKIRVIGLIMAFGGGVLISAVAFDLVEEAASKANGGGGVVFGLLAGCLVFYGGDYAKRLGCMPRSRATAAIGRSDSRAMRTARCRNSGGYLDTPMGHGLLPSRIQGIPDTEPPSNPGRFIVCLGRRNGLRGVNGAIGAVATLFAAVIYNFVAGMMAGIVINLDDAK